MVFTIDIGNTNITCGVLREVNGAPEALFVGRMYTNKLKTSDEYAIDISDIFHLYDVEIKDIGGAVLSSVVPQLTEVLSEAVMRVTGSQTIAVGPGVRTGLNIRIDNPAQLGSDLVASAAAAVKKYPLPAIIIDMGTATKICALNKQGDFIGCAIAPGLRISVDALSEHSAQLPFISLCAPRRAIGTNTVDSMSSGLVYGMASMLDGMIDRFEREMKGVSSIIATGGYSHHVIPHCSNNIVYDEKLLLEGLYAIYHKNVS